MLSNDYSMSAKMLMHPKYVLVRYLSAPIKKFKGEGRYDLELEVGVMS